MSKTRQTLLWMAALSLVTLALLAGVAALTEPSLWVFARAVALASFGSAVRALAERRGLLLESERCRWERSRGGAAIRPNQRFMASRGVSFDI